jgi:hypothetical protein
MVFPLHIDQIDELYGEVLWTIRNPETLEFDPSSVRWITKPDARLTLILSEAEFRDRNLTDLLKNIVSALQIPFEHCAFGVVTGALFTQHFDSLPTAIGLLFGESVCAVPIAFPYKVVDRTVYACPSLGEMKPDREKKRIAWEIMKRFKETL